VELSCLSNLIGLILPLDEWKGPRQKMFVLF